MCAIFKIALEKNSEVFNKLKQRYGEETAREFLDTTLFPKSKAPVIGPQKKAAIMDWGFPMVGKKTVIFNARSETLSEKPMFKKCLKNHCIVPATSFYEWGKDGEKKQKYIITPQNSEFYFAGLWKEYADKDGKKVFFFTILTTEPNSEMKKIHSRMPVILQNNFADAWVETEEFNSQLLLPFDGKLLIEKAV